MSTSLHEQCLAEVRATCSRLPQAIEEPAWVGVRWRIRKHTFVHVLEIRDDWPPAYARVAKIPITDQPVVVMTFRSPLAQLNLHSFGSAPFFRPGWWPNIVGLVLDHNTDWDEARALVAESYRTLAPRKLAGQMSHPRPGDAC